MARLTPPALGHWFGTDEFGRDLLSRILVGARESVGTAVTATALGTLSGAIIGTVSAYLGGRADEAIMRTDRCGTGDSRTAAGAADPQHARPGSRGCDPGHRYRLRAWHGADHA